MTGWEVFKRVTSNLKCQITAIRGYTEASVESQNDKGLVRMAPKATLLQK